MIRLETFHGLDQTSQQHENEIVIEFAPDRLLHFLGVYFVILLAIVAQLSQITGQKASCFPASGERTYGRSFIGYANTYCWEAFDILVPYEESSNGTCSKLKKRQCFEELKLIEDATFVKSFVQWLPRGMLIEAFLFALPSAWWHFRVGARLVGHLKFVKLLLEDIYKSVKDIPAGILKSEPYDLPGSGTANEAPSSWRRWCTNKRPCVDGDVHVEGGTRRDCNASRRFRDRDIVSLLCYENFSSFMHHPFVTSVFKLTSARKRVTESQPLKSALLSHWCHEENFAGNIVVSSYRIKHKMGIVISLISICVMVMFIIVIQRNGWNSETFMCDVLYHTNACMLCIVPRKTETVGFFLVTFLIAVLYFIISVRRLLSFSRKDLTSPNFLDSTRDNNSLALLAAYRKLIEN